MPNLGLWIILTAKINPLISKTAILVFISTHKNDQPYRCDRLSENLALSHKYWIWVRGDLICAGHFSAKLRLLYQGGNIQGVSTVSYWKKKCNFTTLQSVYSCLSVYRHNVTPTFMTAVLPVLAKFWVDASTDLALKERGWWHSFESSGFLKFRSCMHSWELITNLCTKKCNVSSS